MSSAAEAKIGATFLNAKDALPIRTILKELRHPQHPTPMQVDNTTEVGFVNDTINQKQLKAMYMCFYWIRDCICQVHFKIYWGPRSTNFRDYHIKHHSPVHHQLMCSYLFHDEPHVNLSNFIVLHLLQGCVNSRRMRAVCIEPGNNSRRHITDTSRT